MDAFSAQRRYPAVHGQVGGIVLLSKETCTVGKPIPLCPGDLKHCIVHPEKEYSDSLVTIIQSHMQVSVTGNEIHGGGERGGGGKNNTFLSVSFPKAIRMPDERSQGPPCRMEACVARQSP
ncbi:hypothetical protein TNCT_89311 [Trichonephila clavata]|uniref:Uncharacterized protein n=1 Tax=Trichonephila clavata TaxID=2740835 RepID=A0A8X6L2G1_TRICU|nr:hypothetical protein TNCT_89311 [Trichonephila clavata]